MRALRYSFLATLCVAAAACARAAAPAEPPVARIEAVTPTVAAMPAAVYWPVVTSRADWNIISAQPDCVRLRCFEAPRPVSRLDNPQRRHAGVDLFANAGDAVIAVEDGVIVGFYPFLRARTGEMSYALLIAHAGYVANYGEVRENSLRARGLEIGSAVRGGQNIATISDTAQLHFETYAAGTTRNSSWAYAQTRPASVIDPTPRLADLAVRGVRLHP
jgi:murein DD-endopeptidase MepM/ murein hydrolase activator NlpD